MDNIHTLSSNERAELIRLLRQHLVDTLARKAADALSGSRDHRQLAKELAEAVFEDENGDGCDLSAGLFGPSVSAWLRQIAGSSTHETFVQPNVRALLMLAYDWLGDGAPKELKRGIIRAVCPTGTLTEADITWARDALKTSEEQS